MGIMMDITKFSSETRSLIALQVTDPEMLSIFAEDKDWDVRLAVARNRNTSTETLFKLRHDREWYVTHEANDNLKTRGWSLGEI